MGITKGYYDASNIRNIWLRNALVLAPHIPTIIEGVKTMETPNEGTYLYILKDKAKKYPKTFTSISSETTRARRMIFGYVITRI